jgi:hypothetical protein
MCTLTYACVGCEWVLNTLATLVGVHTALPEKDKRTTQVQADTVVTHLGIQKLICTAWKSKVIIKVVAPVLLLLTCQWQQTGSADNISWGQHRAPHESFITIRHHSHGSANPSTDRYAQLVQTGQTALTCKTHNKHHAVGLIDS